MIDVLPNTSRAKIARLNLEQASNLPWLGARTIYLTRHGSHAYGTNIPTSDEDFRGVAIPPIEYLLGTQRFDQFVGKTPDLTVFELRKCVGLASQCNPNVLEVLFTDPSDHFIVTPLGERLLDAREMFVTKRCRHTFSGYATSQLKRIKRHWKWLKTPPKAPPERSAFGLPERTVIPADQLGAATAAITAKLDSWSLKFLDHLDDATRIAVQNQLAEHLAEIGIADEHGLWRAAAKTVGFADNFLELLDAEKRYGAAQKEWESFQRWQRERNPQRAELEAKYGYDTKHAMHLVRLLRMCREILTTGKVIVRRPDAEELLLVRAGHWSYEMLVDWAEGEDRALGELYVQSSLKHSVAQERVDALCIELAWKSLT